MSTVRSFLRRLLVQAVISSTVMAGIQIALHFGPAVFPQRIETAAITTGPAAPPPLVTPEPVSAQAFAQDRTHADVKAGRLPVWRVREAPAAALPPERLASKGHGTGLSDVLLFDKCRPDCESRDPLLAFNQPHGAPPPAVSEAAPEPTRDVVTSVVSDAPEAGSGEGGAPGEGFVAIAARSGASVARRIAGTAGRVVGW